MSRPHPHDVRIELDVIRSFTELERTRAHADPRSSPVAVVLDPSRAAGARLRETLAIPLVETFNGRLACGWAPRELAARALETVEPSEATRLRRAPTSDVRLWTVLHAAETCRVAEHGRRGPIARAAEAEILGFAYSVCGNPRCVDGTENHDWDERECRDQDTREWRDDTTCVVCGMPYDVYCDATMVW